MDGIERIKSLARDITDKPLLKIIEYLLSREDMNEKYLNEEKSLKQMIDFIRTEAQKEAKNGMAMIEDEVVYGWAIHYFDESNKDLNLSTTNKSDNDVEEIQPVANKKIKPKKEVESEGQLQLSLFD